MEFEKLKKINFINFPTDRPIPEKLGRVRGNKKNFKVGLSLQLWAEACCSPLLNFSKTQWAWAFFVLVLFNTVEYNNYNIFKFSATQ